MRWEDDYLDYRYSTTACPSTADDRLRMQVYVDGRLVDSWTEPVAGSR